MSCTKEEIERKRLAALQRRQSKLSSTPSPGQNSVPPASIPTSATFQRVGESSSGFHPYAKPECSSPSPGTSNVPVTKVVSGTTYLISENRFEVNPSEYCTPLISIFKTIPSRNYDAKSKLWNFSIDDYELLLNKVAPLAPHVVLGPLPPYVLKILREQAMDPNTVDLSPVESTLRNKLMPFQAEGVRFGISRRGRCMIADDMGLGKTFQALAIASYYRGDWPLLVVTTSSMREGWQSKIHELLPSVPLMNIASLASGRDGPLVADQQTEVVIVSYKILTVHADLLDRKKFGVVIIDESQYLKSPQAQCTLVLTRLSAAARRVVLLSGTPALSRPSELYTQLHIIEPKLFPNFTQFGLRYCAGKRTAFGWDMTGQSHLPELQALLQRRFLIRRTKDQVLTLEEKTRETVFLDQSLLQFSAEDSRGLSQMAQALNTKTAQDKRAALLTFYSESARVKIPAICKYVKQMLREEQGKFLIFCHHHIVVSAVCQTLDEAMVGYVCIAGGTPSTQRADLVDTFQFTDSCRAAVLSLTAAGAGLTLTAAGLVVFAELHWNPGVLTQAEARAHRLGRSGAVRVIYLLARGTVDDHIWPMLQHKLNVLNDVGLSKDTFEHTTTQPQQTSSNITQYLSPNTTNTKNYIPGTNIRNKSTNAISENESTNCENATSLTDSMTYTDENYMINSVIEDTEKTFLEDEEGDKLLANLDFL